MNPLGLMNNDMATLKMSSQKVFELWNDSVAEGMQSKCINVIQARWNAYLNEMNTRMNIYMRAERDVDSGMNQMRKLCNDLY